MKDKMIDYYKESAAYYKGKVEAYENMLRAAGLIQQPKLVHIDDKKGI